MTPSGIIRAAVVQAEPCWLDLPGAITKTNALITKAADAGASLIAFPECWIPGYPAWIWSRPVDFATNVAYIKNSLKIPSPEFDGIRATARALSISVVLGFSENDHNSLYIGQAVIGPDGEVKTHRRKMKPTHMERTVFGDASGEVFDTVAQLPWGRVGALSCWEHIQPLLKFQTYSQREDVHVAAWPSLSPHSGIGPDLWSMSAEGCQNLSRTYAIESQAYVLHSTGMILDKGVEVMKTAGGPMMSSPGGGNSAIFGPDGRKLTEDLKPTEEGILYADLDLDENIRIKMFADAMGHYSRPDLMWLGVNQEKRKMVSINGTLVEQTLSPLPPLEESAKQAAR